MSTYARSPEAAELIIGSPFFFHVDFFEEDGVTPDIITGLTLTAVIRTSGGSKDLSCDTTSRTASGVDVQLTATQTRTVTFDHDSKLLVTYVDGLGQDVIFDWPLSKVKP